MAWRGPPSCSPRQACSRVERAPAEAGGASRLRRGGGKKKAPRDEAGFSTAISADQLPKTKRSLSAMKAFSPAGAAMAPKGICARSFQLSGRFQVLWVCASTSGL